MNVYWFICVRAAYAPAIPRVAGTQANFNRSASNAIASVIKRRHAVGDLLARPVSTAIQDHLLCDGSAISRLSFPQLFAEIGTEWGAGDGSTTFNIPNLFVAPFPNATVVPEQVITDTTVSTGGTVTVPGSSGETGGSTGGGATTGGRPPPTGITPPAGSSGTAIANSFNAISGVTYIAITPELSVVIGPIGTVTLSATLTVRTARVEPTGIFKVWGKWQWWDGASWQDVAAEIDSDHDSEVFYLDSFLSSSPGGLTVNTSKTGLTPAASAKFRLMARNDTGTRTMTFTGDARAVSS